MAILIILINANYVQLLLTVQHVQIQQRVTHVQLDIFIIKKIV